MKIINLHAENVKRLNAIDITPDTDLVIVGGNNGQGKSSVLDSIMYALAGAASLPEKPLKNGKHQGHIQITLDDMIVTRRFFRLENGDTNSTLEIKNKNGYHTSSPQKMLDNLCGKMSFDPLEFSRLKPKYQLDQLKELVHLDFSAVDAERLELYNARTVTNRELKENRAKIDPTYSEHHHISAVSISGLMDELSGAQIINESARTIIKERDTIKSDIIKKEGIVQDISKQIAKLYAQLEIEKFEYSTLVENLSEKEQEVANCTYINEDEIKEKIKNAESHNSLVKKISEKKSLIQQCEELEHKSNYFTQKIDTIDIHKKELMRTTPFPVNGLGFGENGITMWDIPFEQCSSAEKLRVSVAMGIALNPTLRIMLIRDGSLLDDDSMKIIGEMAAISSTQIWIERVGENEECSVIISDGNIKEIP